MIKVKKAWERPVSCGATPRPSPPRVGASKVPYFVTQNLFYTWNVEVLIFNVLKFNELDIQCAEIQYVRELSKLSNRGVKIDIFVMTNFVTSLILLSFFAWHAFCSMCCVARRC